MQVIQFLLDELGDLALDVLQVVMVISLDLTNCGKDTLFLLRVSQAIEPVSLCCLLSSGLLK
jgi:hypothetical protein